MKSEIKTGFRDFGKFIFAVKQYNKDHAFGGEWLYGGGDETFARIVFRDGKRFTFYSKHLLWLSDLLRLIYKLKDNEVKE